MSNVFKNPAFYRNSEGAVYESYNGEPFQPTDTKLTKKEGAKGVQDDAKKYLRSLLKPGSTVYTILNHRSASGMSRSISLCIADKKGEIIKLDYWVAKAKGEHIDDKHGGLKVGGYGMDMGFHLVYNLGSMLWPNGTSKPHGSRNGKPDNDGGYALKHQWL